MTNRSRSLILVGGSVRAAAVDARRAGYEVIAVDRFGDRDLREICKLWVEYDADHQWITRLADQHSAPIVPVGGFSWPADRKSTSPIGSFLNSRLVAYPDENSLARINSPALLGKLAEQCGASFPETRQLMDGCVEIVFRPIRTQSAASAQWLVKPVCHAGGVGIHVAAEHAKLAPGQFLQRKIKGNPIGANYLCLPGPSGPVVRFLGVYGGLTHRRNPCHRFLYGGSFGPLTLAPSTMETLKTLGDRCASALQLVGLFNIDFICQPDQSLVLLEVNPRYSGSMELIGLESGSDEPLLSLIDWHLTAYRMRDGDAEARCGEFPFREPTPPSAAYCKRIVYAKKEMKPVTLSSGVNVAVCDLPLENALIPAGAPVCTIVISGATSLKQAVQLSARTASRIRRQSLQQS